MREIKFRAWDTSEEEMIINPHARLVYGESINSAFDDDEIVWMQFTGLKDKNGKEIYEGDIVDSGISDVEVVSFGEQEDREKYATYWGFNLWPDWEYEVIGNIYENPELLQG